MARPPTKGAREPIAENAISSERSHAKAPRHKEERLVYDSPKMGPLNFQEKLASNKRLRLCAFA
jgi:hypothetical protein